MLYASLVFKGCVDVLNLRLTNFSVWVFTPFTVRNSLSNQAYLSWSVENATKAVCPFQVLVKLAAFILLTDYNEIYYWRLQ